MGPLTTYHFYGALYDLSLLWSPLRLITSMAPFMTYHFYGALDDLSLAWGPFMDFLLLQGCHIFLDQGSKISLGGPDHKDKTKESFSSS